MALLSPNNRLIECRNVALITTSDPHQVIWLEVQIDIYMHSKCRIRTLSEAISMSNPLMYRSPLNF